MPLPVRSLTVLQNWDCQGCSACCRQYHVSVSAEERARIEAQGWDKEPDLAGVPLRGLFEVETDNQDRMRPDLLVQAVRTARARGFVPFMVSATLGTTVAGALDPVLRIAKVAREERLWLHVDGAFGLWAAAAPSLRHLVAGSERADSWACDAHKWLNVPYDCGIALCAHPDAHRSSMTAQAVYLMREADVIREPMDWTPEHSRRARAVPVYAALRQLGRSGVADLVERSCARARRFAEGIAELPGCEVLNDVVLNQVLFRFADDGTTTGALAAVQASGEAWMSGTEWDGRRAIRLSVSSWRTTERDVDRAVEAFAAALG